MFPLILIFNKSPDTVSSEVGGVAADACATRALGPEFVGQIVQSMNQRSGEEALTTGDDHMRHPSRSRQPLATGAGLAGAALASMTVRAAAQVKRKTFVLVHGSSAGGWCYRRVADLLERGGHKVFAPTLTGLGEHSHLMSGMITLDTHITDVVVIRWESLESVVLVGHSYGGWIISGVAEQVEKKIASIVYTVGYGRPPTHSQFRSGQSGNPAGRRKGVRNLMTDVQRTLRVPVKVKENGRTRKISTQEGALMRLREKALQGDARSLDRLLELAQRFNNDAGEIGSATALSVDDQAILAAYTAEVTAAAMTSQTAEPAVDRAPALPALGAKAPE
jgi:pimeloyl-ACP methyl ester carboxylesterase